ncbi:tyrosine--tRNA ligase [candidate division NPL-UPA2 bacterium]|nr:tyrosine--tRNA ligase [candidate division NPL-UPA2 bacterium]
MKPEEQVEVIKRGIVEIISEKELLSKLRRAQRERRGLRVKFGADPSAPDIHLGHTVPLRKLREMQGLGHEIIFIIGDFTARIGDPSGQSETRRALSEEEVKRNSETYQKQVFKLLDPSRTRVVYNSQWCGRLNFADVINLASKYTVARMLERDDFTNRYKQGRPISIHEFLYPLVQAYDSVILKADVEVGGTDQKFNFLVARDFQREYEQEPQVIVTLPMLEGTDGTAKMSKSLGNYIAVNESPGEIFGKIMSISDELMIRYLELLTDISPAELKKTKMELKRGKLHPRDLKRQLAKDLVSTYHGEKAALGAQREFETIFKEGGLPDAVPEVRIPGRELERGRIWIVKFLLLTKMAGTGNQARRLIKQGGVKIDGEKCTDPGLDIVVRERMLIKVGKRKFARVLIDEN